MESEKPPVLLIDFSALFRRAWHVSAEMSIAFESTVSGVNRAANALPGALVAICCDGKGNWRKSIYPEYKQQREQQPAAMFGEMDRTIERLKRDGRLIWKFDGYEADDVIGAACEAALSRGHTVRIASSDKDLMQLLGVRVDYLATHVWQVVGSEKVREKFGVEPEQLGDWLALVGDASDGVPGCPGIGPVKATRLLKEFGSLAGIWEALDPPEGTEKKRVGGDAEEKALRENVLTVERARKLVTLRTDVPIQFDDLYQERRPQSLTGENNMTDEPESDDGPKDEPVTSASASAESTGSLSMPSAPVTSGTSAPSATALVAYAPPAEFERQLEPMSIAGAFKLARGLFDSRLYSRFPNPEAIMAVIIRGREMGLGALTSLDVFHVIENKPYPHAFLLIARAKADPDCIYLQCVESSPTSATWLTKSRRSDRELSCTFTVDQAKLARLIRPGSGWEKNPEDMCVARAGSKLARREYPGVLLGAYSWQEMDGEA